MQNSDKISRPARPKIGAQYSLPEAARYGYIPGLDGLRAIAVLIVIVAHFGLSHIVPGGFGVTVFFFISGFLITRLLLAEQDKKGRIGLGAFYARRLVRLYPALLFMVFGSSAAYLLAGYGGPTPTEFAAAITYTTNIYQVFSVASGHELSVMPWTPLWSLAVEEHFYLIFPLLVVACGVYTRRLRSCLIALVIFGPLWRLFTATTFNVSVVDYNYMMTDARIDSIAWGCLFTVLLHEVDSRKIIKKLVGFLPMIAAVVLLLLCFLYRDESFRFVWRYSLQGAAILVLMLNFFYLEPLKLIIALMEWTPLTWIGRVSYGLYLWHFPVHDFVERQMGGTEVSLVIQLAVAIAATLVITAISFYGVEQPFNRLRRRFGSYIPVKPV